MRKQRDPVLPDQGGRSMPVDPLNPVSACGDDRVRMRAYEIYEQRGRKPGHDFEHWLEAERELTAER